jgi:hypothetical protein
MPTLPRTFYHLDGIGQLHHLDLVLSIAELDGVQWVPGDGKPTAHTGRRSIARSPPPARRYRSSMGVLTRWRPSSNRLAPTRACRFASQSAPLEMEHTLRVGLARFDVV